MRAFLGRLRASRTGRLGLLASLALVAAAAVAIPALAGTVGTSSGFEDDDGNLAPATGVDWNSFDPTDWKGTAPYRITTTTDTGGWDFTGLEDAQALTSDTAFAGGTKQNKDCATLIQQKADNKADLKRIYLASKTLANGHVILNLAWVRIPQNTTSPSAHVAFEFNQSKTQCGGSSGDLVRRTDGDLLVLYDFEGGNDDPVISISRWSSGDWTAPVALTAGQAEAKVNTTETVSDKIAPTDETLGIKEFGEAGIDLTAANVFPATPTTCLSFGRTFGVTRTSGNSNTAQMKDIVGPADINITNCGKITIKKVTENGNATFNYSTTGGLSTGGSTPSSSFSLQGGGSQNLTSAGQTGVLPGSYTVLEGTLPANWTLKDLVCTASGSGTSATPSTKTATATAAITMAAGGDVTCTYTNRTKVSPTIATLLSAETVSVGQAVHDSATLSGATADAGGTVTYTAYTDNACSQGAKGAGTKTVTNGVVPDSDPITFNSAGDYYWQAVYSGDGNNNGATSVCTSEHLVVTKAQPGISTAQDLIPNDNATISEGFGTPGGTVTFKLFSPSDATCSGTPALSETVNVTGNGTYATANTTFHATTEGTWRWQVSYSGDSNNQAATSACGTERFTIANS